jgi:hypothetical protein
MTWFQDLTGFVELPYPQTQAALNLQGQDLVTPHQRWHIGPFELPSLAELRQRVAKAEPGPTGAVRLGRVVGDVKKLHRRPEFAGAVFQVASQFNMLEMPSYAVTPEAGVAGYAGDPTQGPACAQAAGAATVFRNYLVRVGPNGQLGGPGDQRGQTASLQLDGLGDVGRALATQLDCNITDLWRMQNGYALLTLPALTRVAAHLQGLGEPERDALRQLLRVGWHADTQVTHTGAGSEQRVAQVFCSALPVSYCNLPANAPWQPLAQLVLEATYEATLLLGRLHQLETGQNTVLLTRVGGGVFGNEGHWIDAAVARALAIVADTGLDVRSVVYG